MSNTSQRKQDDEKNGPNTMTAAVAGAVIGAGIAIAGTVALKEENRKKMKDAISNIKSRAGSYMEDLHKKAQDKKELLEDKISERKEDIEKAADAAKDSLRSSKKGRA